MDTVEGWFVRLDAEMFIAVNRWHHQAGVTGDLLEIGVYQGRSAILLGWLGADGEHLEPPIGLSQMQKHLGPVFRRARRCRLGEVAEHGGAAGEAASPDCSQLHR